jgi:hypothetical protein
LKKKYYPWLAVAGILAVALIVYGLLRDQDQGMFSSYKYQRLSKARREYLKKRYQERLQTGKTQEVFEFKSLEDQRKEELFYDQYFRKEDITKREELTLSELFEQQEKDPIKDVFPLPTISVPSPTLEGQIKALIRELGETPQRRFQAIQQLVIMGAPAVPMIEQKLRDPFPFARISALKILAMLQPVSAPPRIVILLRDPDPLVRVEAIKTLADFSLKGYSAHFIHATSDPVFYVRREAYLGLAKTGGPQALDFLSNAIGHNDPWQRRWAVQALGYFSGPSALEALNRALRDQDDRVRLFAITAMGESANPKARVLLNELAKSPDPRVRQAAAQSLRNLDGE